MKNQEKLQKEIKKYRLIEKITIILLPVLILLMIITTNNNITVLAYIFTILLIIDIIIGLLIKPKYKKLENKLENIENISMAIEDNK